LPIEPPVIEDGEWPGFVRRRLDGPAGALEFRIGGPAGGPAVFLAHSILTSSAIWRRPAARFAQEGFRVICADARGHGRSDAPPAPYAMGDLVADVIGLLDQLCVERVNFIGVSQGGMTGLGLAIAHPSRLASLCVVAARADAPTPFQAAWDERIDVARSVGTRALAEATAERWFGRAFLQAHEEVQDRLAACIGGTSTEGFVGCARAIQGLDYLGAVGRIRTPATLLVGSCDDALAPPMHDLAARIAGARLEVIEGAGHLPQLDRPDETEAALLRHLAAPAPPVG
jgi:3-oxoadipate enol-lactonase